MECISHITLIVHDLNKTTKFLTTIFNAKEIYSSDGNSFSTSEEKFFLINDLWLCIMKGDSLSEKTYNHIAFKINEDAIDTFINKIKSVDVEIIESRPRIYGEGNSIYFYDYDNHLFELHTGNLNDRLHHYKNTLDKGND